MTILSHEELRRLYRLFSANADYSANSPDYRISEWLKEQIAEAATSTTVEKFTGDYGGPGRVVARFEPEEGKVRYVVAFKIADGFGEFFHILSEPQLRRQA